MSWTDRLKGEVVFTSPEGNRFTALWKGDDISARKRLGRHAYPGVDGEYVQDMGMAPREFPLTVFFDGPDHDVSAGEFEGALFERGIWSVTHPVYGLLELVLTAYSMTADPVKSGNVTMFKTEWIEPEIDDMPPEADAAAAVENAIESVGEAVTTRAVQSLRLDTGAGKSVAAKTVRSLVSRVISALHTADAKVNAMQRRINNLLVKPYMDVAAIVGGLRSLISAPGMMLGALSDRAGMFKTFLPVVSPAGNGAASGAGLPAVLSLYSGLGRSVTGSRINETATVAAPPAASSQALKHNEIILKEITADLTFSGIARSILDIKPETRREVLTVLNEYQKYSKTMRDFFDDAEALTEDLPVHEKYVAGEYTREALKTLETAVYRYLMTSIYDQRVEKHVVLDRPRHPLEIAISEYGATGENADYFYEFFCRTNKLHGNELLLLPAGREVIVYA